MDSWGWDMVGLGEVGLGEGWCGVGVEWDGVGQGGVWAGLSEVELGWCGAGALLGGVDVGVGVGIGAGVGAGVVQCSVLWYGKLRGEVGVCVV